MFVRIRRYDSIGWPCSPYTDKKTGKRIQPRKFGGMKTHYTVVESIRTEKGPRQRTVASWSNHKSLWAAIADARRRLAEHEQSLQALCESHCFTPVDKRGRHYMSSWRYQWNNRHACLLRQQLEGLEAAFAVLGDWRDE